MGSISSLKEVQVTDETLFWWLNEKTWGNTAKGPAAEHLVLTCNHITQEAKARRSSHILDQTGPYSKWNPTSKKKSSHVNHYPLLLACLQLTYKFGTEPQTKNIRPQYLGTDTDTMEKNSISTWEEKKATYLLLCSQKHPLPHLQGASRGTSGGLHEHFQDYHKPTVWNLAGRE